MNEVVRTNVLPSDLNAIKEIVESTGFFHDYEVDIAVELAEERLKRGIESGYEFIFYEVDGKPVSYSCYGKIPCTRSSYDLYWIATHNDYRGKGIGKKVLRLTEQKIAESGGKGIYVETSSKEQYQPTRKFYEITGYKEIARFKDFYDTNDDKVVYVKVV
jgi:ribosomal protein S18 acetylase RimI-like enzyme